MNSNSNSKLDAFVCLNAEQEFDKIFSFCTLMTRSQEYLEMVESAQKAGFSDDFTEFYYFDNKNSNVYDAYKGINKALRHVKGQYLIFCHQDILFNYDDCQKLQKLLNQLDVDHPDWAIAGNAGKDEFGGVHIRISDAHYNDLSIGTFPKQVMSLDENFLIINRKNNIACSTVFRGFHLYGTDLCQNAYKLGLKSFVIDFHLYHKSPGNVDQSYRELQKQYMDWQLNLKQADFIWAMCSNFYMSNSKLKNWFFNLKQILRWSRTIHKRKLRKTN